MAGRPRKVVDLSTRKISKQDRLARKRQELEIKLDREQLEAGAPAWLGREAAAEYCRVVKEAGKVNLLDNLDLGILAIYADSYARYVEAAGYLLQEGLTITGNNGKMASPYMAIADKCANLILKCSTKLGMATTDRLKLIVPTKTEDREENKYLKYLRT